MKLLHFVSLTFVVGTLAQAVDKSINIHLRPIFSNTTDEVTFINTTLRISPGPSFDFTTPLLEFTLTNHHSSSQRYDDDGLTASDDSGVLPIDNYVNFPQGYPIRYWTIGREPVGDIQVHFVAEPRGLVQGLAGRSDFRKDQGGAVGAGSTFIPALITSDRWNVSITWTVPEDAPEGTHYTSSLGDAPTSFDVGVPSTVVGITYFAVGPLQRWPAWGNTIVPRSANNATRQFGMYWFGDMPWDSASLAQETQILFEGTANYFNDLTSDFRVFYRRDPEAYGGVGGYKSFFIEYTLDSVNENPQDRLEDLVSHEIVHNFANMEPWDDYNKWYVEGVAEYLGAVGPYVGKTLPRDRFIQWLNDNAQDYYTASPLSRTWPSMIENYWTQGTAVVKAPYTRGFMYLAYVQGIIAKHTKHKKSIDSIILELYRLDKAGKPTDTDTFIKLLGKIVGAKAAQESFQAFSNGTTLIPYADGFKNYGLKLVRKDIARFSLGMSENSFGMNQVTQISVDSRAYEAGLREGDVIKSSWGTWSASDTFESKMSVLVERDGGEETIEYWPRARTTVPAYKWVKV